MNFNLGVTKGAKEASSVLNAGIHNATFKGITKDTINGKDGSVYDVMTLTLDIEGYGEFKHNFFEPTSSERSEGMYGPNPSQQEHFLIAVRQILDAVAPSVSEGIDNGTIKIGGTFTNLVNGIKKHTDEYIGVNVQVKILPGRDGYNNIPGFPARITKQGTLGIGTKFIGENLTLSAKELKSIEAAKTAAPTNMAAVQPKKTNALDNMGDDLDDDDLPFGDDLE